MDSPTLKKLYNCLQKPDDLDRPWYFGEMMQVRILLGNKSMPRWQEGLCYNSWGRITGCICACFISDSGGQHGAAVFSAGQSSNQDPALHMQLILHRVHMGAFLYLQLNCTGGNVVCYTVVFLKVAPLISIAGLSPGKLASHRWCHSLAIMVTWWTKSIKNTMGNLMPHVDHRTSKH